MNKLEEIKELEKKYEELGAEIEKLKADKQEPRWARFVPVNGNAFYTINFYGDVCFHPALSFPVKHGDFFRTEQDAEYHLEMLKLAVRVKEFSFEPDWMNDDEQKFCLNYYHDNKTIGIIWSWYNQECKTYFCTKEKAQQAIDLFERDADFLYCLNRGLI